MKIQPTLCGFVLSAICSFPVTAGVSNDMENFFSGTLNVTSPGVANSQMGNHFAGGSLSVRTPSLNVTPVKMTLPSFGGGGCNGIDVFAGAFTMISSDQLVALGKAIASNAATFAFDLAVSTLSPAIANAYKQLRDLANKINQMQINSCEQGAAIVANLWPGEANASMQRKVCQTIGKNNGYFTDSAAAKYECDNKNKTPQLANQARNSPEYQDMFKDNQNSTWKAIEQSNIFTDSELKNLTLTLVGTVISKAATTASGRPDFKYYAGKGGNDDMFEAIMYGGTIEGYSCSAGSSCLSMNTSATITISEDDAFVNLVRNIIKELSNVAKSQTDTLTPRHMAFLNNVTLPIYKMILVDNAYSKGTTGSALNPENYAELVAINYFTNYINSLIESAEIAVIQEYANTKEPSIEVWLNSVKDIKKKIQNRNVNQKQNANAYAQMVEKTMQIERMVSGEITNQVMSSMNFQAN